jgi:RNA polymerase sigma-70 factor (ECF subfamily)
VSIQAFTPDNNESTLIARAQDGDRQAFSVLVLQHREKIIQMVYRMCGDVEIAQDMAQETFIRAWIHLPNYRPRSPFRNWLFRIASNATLDLLRRERETVDVDSLPLPEPGEGIEATLEARNRGAIVREAVLNLPPASRSVLVLREYEELSYREIAETLSIPIGTVMSRLSYARKRLSETLEPLLKEAIL